MLELNSNILNIIDTLVYAVFGVLSLLFIIEMVQIDNNIAPDEKRDWAEITPDDEIT